MDDETLDVPFAWRRRSMKYILDEHDEPVACEDILTWGRWFEQHQHRIVLQHTLHHTFVSTVFIGLDHNFSLTGPPVLWETMIFEGVLDGYQDRYSSKLDALRGHATAVGLVEQYAAAPRKTRKAYRKFFQLNARLFPDEARRLRRSFWRVGYLREQDFTW